jgi:hypothetical protein
MAARNPNWKDNLSSHQWKKGQSGNPGGRPKKIPEIQKLLAEVLGEENGKIMAEEVLRAIRKKALDGDVRAAELLLDRAYGKAKTNIEFTQEGITIKVVRDDGNTTKAEESTQWSEDSTGESEKI